MNRFLIKGAIAGMCILSIALPVFALPPLHIAYPSFPPFHWEDENGKKTGFFYEILTEALEKRMGIPVVWTAYPWMRCQENLKIGKEDAIITVPTKERARYTKTHPDPFYRKALHVFTYAGHERLAQFKRMRTIADLKAVRPTVITYSGNGWHNENLRPLGIIAYETAYLENVWKMLAGKRGDIVIEWPMGAWPDIRRFGLEASIVDTGVEISGMPFHLLIRNSCPYTNRLHDFNSTIQRMVVDCSIRKILTKYEAIFSAEPDR